MPSKGIPKHIKKLIKYLAQALHDLCEEHGLTLLIILETKKYHHIYKTGKAEEYEGRIDELSDVLLEHNDEDHY